MWGSNQQISQAGLNRGVVKLNLVIRLPVSPALWQLRIEGYCV